MPAVVAIGSANVDVIFRVARLVAPGETISAREISESPGGKSANQAVAAARLGARARFIGCLGDDDHGRLLLGSLRDAGVDTTAVRISGAASTGTAYICVDDVSENTIVLSAGANALLGPDDLDEAVIRRGDVVALCGETPRAVGAAAAQRGHEAGATVVFNASPVAAFDPAVLRWVDVLVVNAGELRAIADADTSDSAVHDARTRLGVDVLIVTLGADGVVYDAGAVTRVPGHAVDAVDTTGCGDAFLGALAAGLAAGRDLGDALRRANAAAALAATALGAQPSYPTASTVELLLAQPSPAASSSSVCTRPGAASSGSLS